MEVCDLQARPIFAFPPTASTSPACTDESILDFFFNMDTLFGVQGILFSLATLFFYYKNIAIMKCYVQGGVTQLTTLPPRYRFIVLADRGFEKWPYDR